MAKQPSGRKASSRGRTVAPARQNLSWFYGVVAVIAVLGIAVIAWNVFGGSTSSLPEVEAVSPRPLTVATGTTPEGFAFKGSEDAPVTVVEYGDFECPYCGQFATQVGPSIDQNYIETGKVRWIFTDFPLSQHANAIPSAEAARCAGEQGQFWAMHDLLYERQDEWAELSDFDSRARDYAQAIGLDVDAFSQCLASDKYVQPLNDAQAAAIAAQIPGTPTFLVNGQQVDANQLIAAIDQALAAGGVQ